MPFIAVSGKHRSEGAHRGSGVAEKEIAGAQRLGASIMRSVSSLFRRFFRTVEPDDRAESRRALFDRLLDPGRFTVPKALDFLLRQILSID